MSDTNALRSESMAQRLLVVPDSVVWFLAVLLAVWARYDFSVADVHLAAAALAAAAVAINAAVGFRLRLYSGGYVTGSFDETKVIGLSALISAVFLQGVLALIHQPQLPRSVPAIAGASALVGMWGVRAIWQVWQYHRVDQVPADKAIILGAGHTGVQLIHQMRTDATSAFHPVAVLDDDPSRRHMHIDGIAVAGTRADLATVAQRRDARAVVVAVPDADGAMINEISAEALALGLKTFVLPPLRELTNPPARPHDLKEVELADILGRNPIALDTESIAGRIRDHRVLVTGAGGSIGSELCRLIHGFGPSQLIMLDRDESALHAVQLSIYGRTTSDDAAIVLADIRDPCSLAATFDRYHPQVVFHAAALKHLPILEVYPREAWLTNVVGTMNVLRAARHVGVGTFVNISTDKAADAISVLGASKRVCERLTSAVPCTDGLYVSVRFGNVLGSRGSMLPTFEAQIASGGPVTVTHPDVTRYFMTVTEACQLVLQASTIGRPGEALVLDMGVPVRIAHIAKMLIARSGRDGISIVYTGLRPGEKLHESLFAAGEPQNFRPIHPLISHVAVPPLTVEDLSLQLDPDTTGADLGNRMRAIASVNPSGDNLAVTG